LGCANQLRRVAHAGNAYRSAPGRATPAPRDAPWIFGGGGGTPRACGVPCWCPAVHIPRWVLSLATQYRFGHSASMQARPPESWTKQMQNGVHVLSTDPARLQLDWVTRELQGSYWAASIQRQTVDRCVVGAWCFGAYRQTPGAQEEQVGFGRLITDWATFAYV